MVALFQIMTLDGWYDIITPVITPLPWLFLFFVAYIALAVYALSNLFTAVLVESALQVRSPHAQDLLRTAAAVDYSFVGIPCLVLNIVYGPLSVSQY